MLEATTHRTLAGLALCLMLQACDDDDAPSHPARHPKAAAAADPGPPDAASAGTSADGDAALDAATAPDATPESHSDDAGAATPDPDLPLTAWRELADTSWSEWYRFLPSRGRDDDPSGVFTIEDDGTLHVLGIEPPQGDQEFGYMATRDEHANYRFRVEQRWGTRKFAPRLDAVRDSGLLYHMRGDDKVWPQSVEFQIQENDIGDLYLLSDVGATTLVDPAGAMWIEGGEVRMLRNGALKKGSTHESADGWNSLELIASEREFVHVVNGFVNHRGWALEYLAGDSWLPLDRGRILLQAEGAEVFYRRPQLRALRFDEPPADSVVLFDGSNLDAFQAQDGTGWHVADGALEVEPGSGDLRSKESFGDVRLHVEFRVPASAPDAAEQERGNSGIYLQGRYEVQILDSFARPLANADDAGAIYGVRDATLNEALPPETWQVYDIVFRAARFVGGAARTPARITLVWNGSEVQHAVDLPGSTNGGDPEGAGPGPLRLQDHGQRVRFRNIWLQRL
jgi:hypothetical protein